MFKDHKLTRWIARAMLLSGIVVPVSSARSAEEEAPTAMALRSMFDPWRAPANKTMGLAQRSFVDLVEKSQKRLEIAIVVDGTESMGASLEGIQSALQKMVADVNLYKDSQVSFQLVVFRDIGAGDSAIEFPFTVAGRKFSTDIKSLSSALQQLKAHSGAPFFPELIDAGIQAALADLEWSEDADTSRWVLVFGDAPPYDAGFEDEKTQARRRYNTDYLVSLAERKGIKINCVLCTSRDDERSAYEKVLDKTRQFMSTLATETDGLMLDLSYPDIREAIQAAANQRSYESVKLGRIQDEDIQRLRDEAERVKSLLAESRRVRIAILPHLPLNAMSFDPKKEEVQLAIDLREKLRRVPGIDVKSSSSVRQQWESLTRRGVKGTSLLQTLATVLDVDYILWGEVTRDKNVLKISSSIYDGTGGRKVVDGSALINQGDPASNATGQLSRTFITNVLRTRSDQRLAQTFARLETPPLTNEIVITPVANRPAAVAPLLVGYDLLEQALEFEAGDPQAEPLLQQAETSLQEAVQPTNDPENSLAHLLLANCYFNQAQILAQRQQSEQATAKLVQFRATLNNAYRNMNRLPRAELKTEIKSDHLLLSQKKPTVAKTQEAIEGYESLTKVDASGSDPIGMETALRAHWMLAGIYSGDWGVDESLVDPEKAKQHLTQILAHWPDSHQAKSIRTHLRWDSQAGENALEHFPRQNDAALATEAAGAP